MEKTCSVTASYITKSSENTRIENINSLFFFDQPINTKHTTVHPKLNMEEQPTCVVTVTPTPRKRIRDDAQDDESFAATAADLSKICRMAPPSETSYDELMAMLQVERNHYGPPTNYLLYESCKGGVNENWRRRLCEWMFEVTDHYDFDREVVSVAFDYLDRSISLSYGPNSIKKLSKRDYQLYAVTSLYLAIKIHGEMDPDIHGGERVKLRIEHFTQLSRGFFKTETIEAKEREILNLFNWRVNPPTCAQYLSSFLRVLPEWELNECENPREDIANHIFDVAKYLTELSVFVSDFSFTYNPSTIAYSAILCALDYMEGSPKGLPSHIHIRFLCNINKVSDTLNPESKDVQHIQMMLKKLAPKMFTTTKDIYPLARTVSLLEVDTTNSVVATSSTTTRAISPVNTSGRSISKTSSEDNQANTSKRQKV